MNQIIFLFLLAIVLNTFVIIIGLARIYQAMHKKWWIVKYNDSESYITRE